MASKIRAPEVYKFGGASLGDGAAFERAAGICRRAEHGLVVVCSAPAGVTDLLLEVAARASKGDRARVTEAVATLREKYAAIVRSVGPKAPVRAALREVIDQSMDELETLAGGLLVLRELTPRTSDFLVARGERVGARIFAATLAAAGISAQYVDALEVVVTDGPFGGAAPNLSATDHATKARLGPLLARGVVPVVPGFLGAWRDESSDEPAVATLGRGGSDLTATLLGRALGARRVCLWKDVPGLLTADPRVVPDARVIPQLNVREAAELAYYGAKVLHPRALIPIADRSVPLFVRPFGDADARGTEISARRTLDDYPVKALSAIGHQALVTVAGRGLLGVPGVAARTFAVLAERGMSTSLITQASSEQSICFTVPESDARAAKTALERAFAHEISRGEVDGISVEPGLSTVAVVGLGMAGTRGIASRVFSALASGGINVIAIAQGSSELNISFVVKAGEAAAAQRSIHQAFQLAKIGGGHAAQAGTMDVILLGFGQIGRTLAALVARRKTLPHVRVVGIVDRSGFVHAPKGLSPAALGRMFAAKAAGRSAATLPGGVKAEATDAVAFFARHALVRPVLVDVTAEDTTNILVAALQSGMDVVMANKRPLSAARVDRDRLLAAAEAHGRRLRFEATVGAGLPILDTYRKLVESGDKVTKIEGCLSGTLGYVLTEVGRGKPFSEAILSAKAHGFTEPDPRDDLSGMDVARKALILGRLLGFPGEPADVEVESLVPEGARTMSVDAFLAALPRWDRDWKQTMAKAAAKQRVPRYVATVTSRRIVVGLRLVPKPSPFGSLEGTDNQVAFTTSRYRRPLVIKGAGAGLDVTAGGVLNDILQLA